MKCPWVPNLGIASIALQIAFGKVPAASRIRAKLGAEYERTAKRESVR